MIHSNHSKSDFSLAVAAESGTITFTDVKQSWSQTFGPVQNGFRADISVEGASSPSVQIYVSRGNEPFALKAAGSDRASYVIDF